MIEFNGHRYRELRCKNCRKLICYEHIFAGRVAYTCPRCGELNEFVFKHLKTGDNINTMEEFSITTKPKGGGEH